MTKTPEKLVLTRKGVEDIVTLLEAEEHLSFNALAAVALLKILVELEDEAFCETSPQRIEDAFYDD